LCLLLSVVACCWGASRPPTAWIVPVTLLRLPCKTCVLIAYGYYDPAPLERPGRPHVQCMRWWHGRWEFICLDGDEPKSLGTEIYGFEVQRYYMYHEFVAEKERLEKDNIG